MAGRPYSVIIVGAGPTGLSLAIELGSRGVSCLVVERNDRVGYAPRAKTTNVRTRTHLRRWGIADRLAAVSPFGVDYPADVMFVTSLSGPLLAKIENASNCAPARNPLYPEHGQWVPQYKLEQVLREHADTLPQVEIRFSTEFTGATQDDAAVTVQLKDVLSGQTEALDCDYLVGADGARSRVREMIGAKMSGRYGLSRNYNIIFRAPGLAQAHSHGPAAMYWQATPVAPSVIGPMDRDDKGDIWVFAPTRLAEGVHLSDDDALDLIRRSTGIDLPYEILSRDEWIASSLIADRYRDGRIVLAGDACHLHPPFGGYGMNMGISDGVDLGWKLAAMEQGWGGAALLDSYETERRQIHQEVIAEAEANHAVLSNELSSDVLEATGPAGEAARREIGKKIVAVKQREFHTLGTVLGGRYRQSPLIPAEPGQQDPKPGSPYEPLSTPGSLAPHFWRGDTSVYDLFGQGFTLVCRPEADAADIDAALADARRLGAPLTLARLGADEAADLYPARLTLIRPDQHVAWRGEAWVGGVLDRAAGWGGDAVAVVQDRRLSQADA